MDEVGIDPTSSIGDALAIASSKSLRELLQIPAGIGLPLAELILGRGDFAFCGRRPKGSALWTSASLERLDLTFCHDRPHDVRDFGPTLCASVKPPVACDRSIETPKTYTIYLARWLTLLFLQSRRSARRRSSRIWERRLCAARMNRREM